MPRRFELNAIHLPSGENVGEMSFHRPPVSHVTQQFRWMLYVRMPERSPEVTANASVTPSGSNAGVM